MIAKKTQCLDLCVLSQVSVEDLAVFLEWLKKREGPHSSVFAFSMFSGVSFEKSVLTSGTLESFGFVYRAEGAWCLSESGDAFLCAHSELRRSIIAILLEADSCFGDLMRFLRVSDRQRVKRDVIVQRARRWFPLASTESLLLSLLTWGGYSGVLSYDFEHDEIRLNPLSRDDFEWLVAMH